MLGDHLQAMGYEQRIVFSPQRHPDLETGVMTETRVRTQEALREVLEQTEAPVAVVSPTDYGARFALKAARDAGRSVPEEVGVAGVGGRSLDAVLSDLSLTSVALPYEDKGRRSAELLKRQFQCQSCEIIRLLPVRLLPGESTRRKASTQPLRDQVDGLLQGELRNPPPVADWARRCGRSRRSFERAFAEETGTTPYDYLLRLREAEAKRLMKETDWSLARIGEAVGFPDPPRFSAFFRKRTGMPASVWRQQSGETISR
jgi:AraC-like DNA-binding protein